MTRSVQDPLATLPFGERWSLHWRLWRAWRQGVARRNARILRSLRSAAVGAPLIGVRNLEHGGLNVAELDFAGGSAVWIGDCHVPTILSLQRRAERGRVVLEEAAHHGPYWGFYFSGDAGRFPVLAADARLLRDGRGGGRTPEWLPTVGPRPGVLTPV